MFDLDDDVLRRRVGYGGKKGRAALRRLRRRYGQGVSVSFEPPASLGEAAAVMLMVAAQMSPGDAKLRAVAESSMAGLAFAYAREEMEKLRGT